MLYQFVFSISQVPVVYVAVPPQSHQSVVSALDFKGDVRPYTRSGGGHANVVE